jgi:hypothetical protein
VTNAAVAISAAAVRVIAVIAFGNVSGDMTALMIFHLVM